MSFGPKQAKLRRHGACTDVRRLFRRPSVAGDVSTPSRPGDRKPRPTVAGDGAEDRTPPPTARRRRPSVLGRPATVVVWVGESPAHRHPGDRRPERRRFSLGVAIGPSDQCRVNKDEAQLIHGVGARRTTSDWTPRPSRGTTGTTGSVCRSSRRSRGSGGPVRALILSGPTLPDHPSRYYGGGYGRRRPRGRKQPRPPGLAKPLRPRFRTAPTAIIYS